MAQPLVTEDQLDITQLAANTTLQAAFGGSTTAGDVGSYAFTKRTDAGSIADFGDTLSGADMQPAHAGGTASGTSLTGTWRCMGYALQGAGNSEGATTLWVRIA